MKNHLSIFLKSKDVRRLLENFFSLSILKLFNIILPFVTLPYLIKVLGFQKYGAIVLALSLIAYFQAITDYGFNLSATREIARHKHSKKQLSYIYSKTMWSKFFLLFFCLNIYFIIIFFVPLFRSDFLVYLLMCLPFIGQTFFPEWFFRGIEKMRYITIMDLMVKLGFTFGVFFLIKTSDDYWIYPFIFGICYILSAFFSNLFLYKKLEINFIRINSFKVILNLKSGFPLFLNQFVPNLFNNTTNFLVGVILGKSAAGIFGVTRQVVQILTVFNSVVSTTFFPYLVKNKDKFHVYKKIYLFIYFIFCLIIWFFHKNIFDFLGLKYENLEIIFLFLVLGAFSIVIYSIYATNYLIARGKDRVVMKITIFASIFGFIFAYPLIESFGILGAASNIFMCQLILAIGSYVYFRKDIGSINNER